MNSKFNRTVLSGTEDRTSDVLDDEASQPQKDVLGLVTNWPWILPANRKLRHLQGVSVRNLSLDRPKRESRTQTIDDDALLATLNKSDNHRADLNTFDLAQRSSSLSDLTSVSGSQRYTISLNTGKADGTALSKPLLGTLRRRSTNNWSNITPDIRQRKLEDVAEHKLAEAFFTIQGVGMEKPLYVSESIDKTMNPNFKFFDLNNCDSSVTRLNEVILSVWARHDAKLQYIHLVQMQVHLASLKWVCKSPGDSVQLPLPSNCILFHFTDGIYTHAADAGPSSSNIYSKLPITPARPFTPPGSSISHRQFTSTFDSLMKLKNIDECIQDATATAKEIVENIDKLLDQQKSSRQTVVSASTTKESLISTNAALTSTNRSIFTSERSKAEIKDSNTSRHNAMSAGRVSEKAAEERHKAEVSHIDATREQKEELRSKGRGHVRRIVEDLSNIYPIEPLQGKPLAFAIASHHLPNADDLYNPSPTAVTEQATAAALSYIAVVMLELAQTLNFAFPYPIIPLCSNSSIEDPITSLPGHNASRIFPLYQTGVAPAHFEYGVYLLNQDLIGLMNLEGLRVVNPKTTLANLKYLLEVLCSGKGEVPARKTGGIRALESGIQRVNVEGEIWSAASVSGSSAVEGASEAQTEVANGNSTETIEQTRNSSILPSMKFGPKAVTGRISQSQALLQAARAKELLDSQPLKRN